MNVFSMMHLKVNPHTNFCLTWAEIVYAWKFVDVTRKLWDIEKPHSSLTTLLVPCMGPAASDEPLAHSDVMQVGLLSRSIIVTKK